MPSRAVNGAFTQLVKNRQAGRVLLDYLRLYFYFKGFVKHLTVTDNSKNRRFDRSLVIIKIKCREYKHVLAMCRLSIIREIVSLTLRINMF